MTRGFYGALFSVLLGCSLAAQDQPTCAQRQQEIIGQFALTNAAMHPAGPLIIAFDQATRGIEVCPADETLWYLLLRSAELGGGGYPVTLAGTAVADLQSAAELAHGRFPHSSKIATIFARISGTVEAAQQAVSADQTYPPARVALASAFLRAGDAQSACKILEGTSDLNRMPGAFTLLARARLVAGDSHGSIDAALKEPPRIQNAFELGGGFDSKATESTEVAGLAYVAANDLDRGALFLLRAAAEGSANAKVALEKAAPGLRRSLLRLRRNSHLTPAQQALLAEIEKRWDEPGGVNHRRMVPSRLP